MKLLVSDYDGTLKTSIKNLKLNISAINDFRKKGNHFVIATGRSYDSIKSEIDKYGIKYDYLITNDGMITFNNENKIINSETFDNNLLETLYNHITGIDKYRDKIKKYTLPNSDKIIELELLTSIFDRTNEVYEILENYPDVVEEVINVFLFKIIFLKKYGNKGLAIKKLIKLLDIKYDKIITVGNGKNDIEMLTRYNGYKMLFSSPSLYGYNLKTINEVHQLVKKTMF